MARPEPAQALVEQRWFRAKGRPVARVAQVDAVRLPPADLGVVEVAFDDGGAAQRYLTFTVDGVEPSDGDGAWAAIATLMSAGGRLEGRAGAFQAAPTAAFDAIVGGEPEALSERRLRVEQSNTSAVLGERAIIKLFRLLEPGENPDLEVTAFLTDAGFAGVPALGGRLTWIPHGAEPSAAAMLQAFVSSDGDGWTAMLDALATDPARALDMARAIGHVTADLHAALASRPSPAFPVRVADVSETSGWRAAAEEQLALATAAVRGVDHDRLVRVAPALRARFGDAFGSVTGGARVTRIHGDLHLGQLLSQSDGGFTVIDFEGEPARPIAERRRPTSPLRDVAGLLRSLDYAARTAERDGAAGADAWLARARAAFIDAYGATAAPLDRALLRAFELEKACYEVRYEAANRPDWLWLPLAALERLADPTE
jgi:maltokinase